MLSSKFSGNVPYMNRTWPDDFAVSLEATKASIAKDKLDLSDFGPLSLFFTNRILGHITATTMVRWKGLLNSISNRDTFILYGLLKKL